MKTPMAVIHVQNTGERYVFGKLGDQDEREVLKDHGGMVILIDDLSELITEYDKAVRWVNETPNATFYPMPDAITESNSV